MSAYGTKRTSAGAGVMSTIDPKQTLGNSASLILKREFLSSPPFRGRIEKCLNEVGKSVPVGELAITLARCCAAAPHDDEFDDLLLEVIVLCQAQSTSEKEGHARMPPCDRDEMIHVSLRFCPLTFQYRRQTDGYEG